MNKNIVLIGMPGSGKSTVGVLLAKAIGFSFVDTDLIISQKVGKKLQEIIDNDGLTKFLEIENEVGAEINCQKTVIATGGSMIMSEKAMKNLKNNGTVVFIDVPIDEIKRRVKNIKTRGIACHKGETLDDVFCERLPLYKKYADITVGCNANNIEATVENICKFLE